MRERDLKETDKPLAGRAVGPEVTDDRYEGKPPVLELKSNKTKTEKMPSRFADEESDSKNLGNLGLPPFAENGELALDFISQI